MLMLVGKHRWYFSSGLHCWLLLVFAFIISSQTYGQLTKIMGTVTDSASGEPMPFVNVLFKGSTIGITTDFDGNYSIETTNPGDTLLASFVGYERMYARINKGQFQVVDFNMKAQFVQLEDVIIRPGVNPAEIILDSIIANKKDNDPDHFDAYEYEAYNKIELDANNITEKFRNRRLYRPFKFIFQYVDTSTVNGKTYLPIFLSETMSDVYFRKNPRGYIEKIKATKISGFNNQSAMQLLGDEYLNTNIYDKYYLVDSASFDGKWCYKLMFKPRLKQTLTFTGNMWVHDTTWAVTNIEMRVADDANMNFINDLLIKKDFEIVDGEHWAVVRDYTIVDFNIIENNKKTLGFFGKKTTTYKNYVINKPKETSLYTSAANTIVQTLTVMNSGWKTDMRSLLRMSKPFIS